MASLGEDIAREILLKLPTRDLVRYSCVCKLWHSIVLDPSFRALHGNAHHVGSGEAETLLVSELSGRGIGLEMAVLSVRSGKPMCRFTNLVAGVRSRARKPICGRFTNLAAGYSPVNACNGFILLASGVQDWPVYVCNPVTREKLKIPAPPEMVDVDVRVDGHAYAIGFSRSTRMYKLFHLSFTTRWGWSEWKTHESYVDIYTLGTGYGGWRRHKNSFDARYTLHPPPPVLVDGKLYVVIDRSVNYHKPEILVIDVASEEHDTYRLPEKITGGWCEKVAVVAFNLQGQLCVAIRIIGRRRINFWVLRSLQKRPFDGNWRNWRMPDWERRYTFYLDADREYGYDDKPSCAWLDCRDGMLCYRFGDRLYKYDTTRKRKTKHLIQLPAIPSAPPENQRWNVYDDYCPSLLSPHIAFADDQRSSVYGGYGPSLLSPHVRAPSESLIQQHRDKQEQFEHTLLHALRRQPPSKKLSSACSPPDCSSNHHCAKRIRKQTR